MTNLDVLSERYATPEMNKIFSREGKIILERDLWIAVMKAQRELGLDIASEEIEKFERAKPQIDLARIDDIEARTKHDVKARIQSYVETAGAGELIHLGMTSRDLTDNVEQMQNRQAATLMLGRYVALLSRFLEKADDYRDILLTGRTHNQPAQPTLLGRRFSMWAEELGSHLGTFEHFIEHYPLRGMKGAVGTQFDMLTLLGSIEKVDILEAKVADLLGFKQVLHSPGQVYARSFDYDLLSNFVKVASACANFGLNMRLMAGYELVTEGFREGQVGSSAMPHKMNTPLSERVRGFHVLLTGYASMAADISGDQWFEGDVSESVVRRVILSNGFYTFDGLSEATHAIVSNMGIYEVVISAEVDRYLPFLATTEILMSAVQKGMGRERAHGLIKKYAVEEALKMRAGEKPQLAQRLAADPAFVEYGIAQSDLETTLQDRMHFVGTAQQQIGKVRETLTPLLGRYQGQIGYVGQNTR